VAFMMNKLAMINSCEIILQKNIFFAKNHCEIQLRTILVCALYAIKYGIVNNLVPCVLNLMFNFILRWHLGFCNEAYLPTRRGFDTFYGFYTGSQDYFTHKRKPVGKEV
jgi:hypothetical protein